VGRREEASSGGVGPVQVSVVSQIGVDGGIVFWIAEKRVVRLIDLYRHD
jgi:hypothetical protein